MNPFVTKIYAAGLSQTFKNFIDQTDPECKDLGVILCIIERVINFLLALGGALTFIMIIYTAIIYLTSYGDESKIEMAKKTLIWSVIGVIVIILSRVILKIISNILNKNI